MFRLVNKSMIDNLSQEAIEAVRLRKNCNFHETSHDVIQRMLNAFEPDSYVQPHKHENPDKREVFILLRGQLLVCFFSDNGELLNKVVLDHELGNYAVEIPPKIWHTVFALESGTVVYEVKDGPYIESNDKIFAPWAPTEGSDEASDYLQNLVRQCEQF